MRISVWFQPSASRTRFVRWVVLLAWLWLSQTERARAFGGVWSASGEALEQTAEQLILIDNPDGAVTAIIQLTLDGPAQELTWLVPVPAQPNVGFASNTLFQRLLALTAPQHWVEVTDTCSARRGDAGLGEGLAGAPEQSPARAKISERETLRPEAFTTLDLAADSGDLAAELTQKGYPVSERLNRELAPYVASGAHWLALKLKKPAGSVIVRPLMIAFAAEQLAIPLRASAGAARADMPLQLWVFGRSHAIPTNYQTLVINDALFDWQSAEKFRAGTSPANGAGSFGPIVPALSNYEEVVTQAANAARAGQGFFVEYSAPASHVRDVLWSELDESDAQRIKQQSDGFEALQIALQSYRNWDGLRAVVKASTQLPQSQGASLDALLENPAALRGKVMVDNARFQELLEREVLAPVRDAALLLRGTPYMTQLYTTLSADEMTLDPTFDYNLGLALVSNVRIAKQIMICEPHARSEAAQWRVELPQGGAVYGSGMDWPIALDAMPANLKIVELSERGSGHVVADNSRAIGHALYEAAGANGTGVAIPEVPQNGLAIGADQTIVPELKAKPRTGPRRGLTVTSQGFCSVSTPQGGAPRAGLWLLAIAWVLRLRRTRRFGRALLLGSAAVSGCSEDAEARGGHDAARAAITAGALTPEQLRDPETCKECHPSHYREWSGSMHAFASRDPVFRAMNRRGQRETGGELGDFCVNCHAPMAVRDKLTHDGLNLDQLEHEDRGVTCYFCHSVVGVDDTHNAKLRLADDMTLRGPFDHPLATIAHGAEQSPHFDENAAESSRMCGACHDIIMPKGVAIERTFREYERGLFAKVTSGIERPFASCVGCHMQGRKGVAAAVPGAPERVVHEHFWPGIDVALGDFPHREAMRSAIEDCQLGNASVSYFSLEVTPPDLFTFQIETNAGHNQPSGASQDRRMWLEFLAYDEDGRLIPEASSGNIADGELEEKPADHPEHDPQLVLFGDRLYDENGKRVHMFWDAAKSQAYPKGYESIALPGASTTYIEGKHVVVKQLRAAGPNGLPARVTARLRIRPIGVDVLDDLVHSGDLDPAIAAEMPTLTFGAQIEWTAAAGTLAPVYATPKSDCSTYRCLLDPNDPECQ